MSRLPASEGVFLRRDEFRHPHAMTSINGVTLAYDNNGNLTALGSNSCT